MKPIELISTGVAVLHKMPGCKVERFPGDIVVKSGSRVLMDEFEALRLLSPLHIATPCAHSATTLPDGNIAIRMDFVPGEMLDKVWLHKSDEDKRDIARQLRRILEAMRSLPPPKGFIGSCSGGAVRDMRRFNLHTGGPFSNEEGFNEFIMDLLKATPVTIRRALDRRLRKNHRIFFTHGDIAQHNIIVQGNTVAGLIDWESSGWYPEYWEYVKFFERFSPDQDWKNYADDIFPQMYDDELLDYLALTQWQRP